MRKKVFIPTLIVVYLVTSVISFYSFTRIASNICNYRAPNLIGSLLITFSSLFIVFSLIAAMFLLTRLFKHIEYKKKIITHYSIIILVLASIGFISSIVGPILMYGTLVSSAPFKGYSIICLIANLALIAASIFGIVYCKKHFTDDEEKEKVTGKQRLFKGFIGFYTYYASVKMGALIYAPVYALGRNFHQTVFFYLFLLVFSLILLVCVLDYIGVFEEHKLARLITSISVVVANIVLFILFVCMASGNSEYLSSISSAMPIERLVTKPYELIIQTILTLILSAIILFKSIKLFIKKDQ